MTSKRRCCTEGEAEGTEHVDRELTLNGGLAPLWFQINKDFSRKCFEPWDGDE